MKVWERIFLYSIIAIMAFHLFLVDSKVESQGSVQEVIRAKHIEIVNDEGQPVVRLWDSGYLGGVVGVYDRNGTLIAKISSASVLTEGGAVTVYNQDGTRVANLRADEEGGVVSVYDKDDTIAVKMFVDQIEEIRGGGVVNVYNQDGTRVVDMSTYKEGGVVSVRGKDDTVAVVILADEEGGGMVHVLNKNEHLAVAMSGRERGQTAIYNDEGNPLVGMRETDEGHGEIVVFSRSEKILGIIP